MWTITPQNHFLKLQWGAATCRRPCESLHPLIGPWPPAMSLRSIRGLRLLTSTCTAARQTLLLDRKCREPKARTCRGHCRYPSCRTKGSPPTIIFLQQHLISPTVVIGGWQLWHLSQRERVGRGAGTKLFDNVRQQMISVGKQKNRKK
jgi:hypothetical protein